MYSGHPNIIQTYRGCPNIWGTSKHMGGVQTCVYLDALICLDGPCMFGHPHMFGCSCKLGCSLCLDALCMLGHPHMFRCPPYVWMPHVQTQHKESMLCQTKGVFICPIHVDAPCTSTTERKHALLG